MSKRQVPGGLARNQPLEPSGSSHEPVGSIGVIEIRLGGAWAHSHGSGKWGQESEKGHSQFLSNSGKRRQDTRMA